MGVNISAEPRTGPLCVTNISFTSAPRFTGLGTDSNPPVTETTCNLLATLWPSGQRSTAGVVWEKHRRVGRREEMLWGRLLIGQQYVTDGPYWGDYRSARTGAWRTLFTTQIAQTPGKHEGQKSGQECGCGMDLFSFSAIPAYSAPNTP